MENLLQSASPGSNRLAAWTWVLIVSTANRKSEYKVGRVRPRQHRWFDSTHVEKRLQWPWFCFFTGRRKTLWRLTSVSSFWLLIWRLYSCAVNWTLFVFVFKIANNKLSQRHTLPTSSPPHASPFYLCSRKTKPERRKMVGSIWSTEPTSLWTIPLWGHSSKSVRDGSVSCSWVCAFGLYD